ncbi:MAG: hypothetical protein JO035_04830, partial [Betaproteobacteria bacterium]|nr:hypothetical protein [Betaproteobacteria bacterium]
MRRRFRTFPRLALALAAALLVAEAHAFTVKTRLAGAQNWSVAATWIKTLTGTVTFTNGNVNVAGVGTLFLTEVSPGDVLMIDDGTVATVRGTVKSITNNTALVLTAGANGTRNGAYGKEAVPAAADDVQIGNTNVASLATITLDVASATVNSLTFAADNLAHSLTHSGTNALTVSTNVTVNQPTANNTTIAWNINGGSAAVTGNLTLGGANNTATRIADVVLTTGSLTISGNLNFTTGTSAAVALIDLSGGAGTLNIAGAINPSASNRGTLTPGTTSTVNFNGTAAQTITLGVATITYNNVTINNTAGVTPSAAITATNVTGNLNVQTGTLSNGG